MVSHSVPRFILLLSCALSPLTPRGTCAQQLDKATIRSIAQRVIALVDSHYVFPAKKPAITAYVRSRRDAGLYDAFVHPDSLARALTRDLRAVSGDRHLYVEPVTERHGEPIAAMSEELWARRERVEERIKNFGFVDARVLDGNVGYLRIVEFMHPDRGFDAASSAMRLLANTDAMVIDVRGNGGGYGGLVDLILSYYFDSEPTHISTTHTSDRTSPPTKSFTLPFVPGQRRVGQPLYVLIDQKTGSAAEFFAYTLQAFKKAVVVGQASAGAAHMNSYYGLGANFRVSISTGAPLNPVTNANWEGVGVKPEVKVPPAQALLTSHRLALEALLARATDSEERDRLSKAIEGLPRLRE